MPDESQRGTCEQRRLKCERRHVLEVRWRRRKRLRLRELWNERSDDLRADRQVSGPVSELALRLAVGGVRAALEVRLAAARCALTNKANKVLYTNKGEKFLALFTVYCADIQEIGCSAMLAYNLLPAVSTLTARALLSASGEQRTRPLRLVPLRHHTAHFTLKFKIVEIISPDKINLFSYEYMYSLTTSILVCKFIRVQYILVLVMGMYTVNDLRVSTNPLESSYLYSHCI